MRRGGPTVTTPIWCSCSNRRQREGQGGLLVVYTSTAGAWRHLPEPFSSYFSGNCVWYRCIHTRKIRLEVQYVSYRYYYLVYDVCTVVCVPVNRVWFCNYFYHSSWFWLQYVRWVFYVLLYVWVTDISTAQYISTCINDWWINLSVIITVCGDHMNLIPIENEVFMHWFRLHFVNMKLKISGVSRNLWSGLSSSMNLTVIMFQWSSVVFRLQ